MEEKRRSQRLELQVNIQMERIDEEDGITTVKYAKVDVTDLSRNGIGFTARQQLQEHTYYNTEIQIWTKEVINAVIKIVRRQEDADGSSYHYGAEFIGMTDADALKIDIYQMLNPEG